MARLTFDELEERLEWFAGDRVRFTVLPLLPGEAGRAMGGPAGFDVFGEIADDPSIIETDDGGLPERHICVTLEGGGHIAIGEPEFEYASLHDEEGHPYELVIYMIGLMILVSGDRKGA
jgi:hypothetical protein